MGTAAYELKLYDRANGLVAGLLGIAKQTKGSVRPNRPHVWTCQIPVHKVTGTHSDGYRKVCSLRRCLRVYRTPSTGGGQVLVHNGIVVRAETKPTRNGAVWEITSVDPMWWWQRRPVRDADGSIVSPTFDSPITAASILLAALENSISNAGDPGDQEGPLGLDVDSSNFDTSTGSFVDSALALIDWPITIGDLATLLTDSGKLDIRIHPVAGAPYDPDIMGYVEAREDIGDDVSGTVAFEAGTGALNATARFVDDGTTICNKLWDYFGPKRDDTHWKGLITADDGALPDPPQTDLDALISSSRTDLGVFMDIRTFDVGGTWTSGTSQYRKLFERLWQSEQLLRVLPRQLLFVTPEHDCAFKPFEHYREGDLVSISTDEATVGVGFTNVAQRVYGFDITPDDKTGAEIVSELITSADQEI